MSVRVSHPIIAAADVAKITLMDNGGKKKKVKILILRFLDVL